MIFVLLERLIAPVAAGLAPRDKFDHDFEELPKAIEFVVPGSNAVLIATADRLFNAVVAPVVDTAEITPLAAVMVVPSTSTQPNAAFVAWPQLTVTAPLDPPPLKPVPAVTPVIVPALPNPVPPTTQFVPLHSARTWLDPLPVPVAPGALTVESETALNMP